MTSPELLFTVCLIQCLQDKVNVKMTLSVNK